MSLPSIIQIAEKLTTHFPDCPGDFLFDVATNIERYTMHISCILCMKFLTAQIVYFRDGAIVAKLDTAEFFLTIEDLIYDDLAHTVVDCYLWTTMCSMKVKALVCA